MYKLILFILILSLTGCVTNDSYGNFVENPTEVNLQKITNDTVEKIIELYPPAKTRFELQQATPDAFGQSLVRNLREHGYAILEFTSKANKSSTDQIGEGLPFRYILDQFASTHMYRVTIEIGNESLTRPYLQENDGTILAGCWVRKE